jgi:hypothetical protein
VWQCIAGKFTVCKPFSADIAYCHLKAIHVIAILAIIETKCLLVNVAKQVERFNRDVGAT